MAANQHGLDFKLAIKEKYNQPVAYVLLSFAQKGMTYKMVADLTGFKIATIRKYCRIYKVRLASRFCDIPAENEYVTNQK